MKLLRAPIAAALLLLALAGCRVDQAKEVRTYRSVLDAGVEPVDFAPGQPLSLEEALRLANQHNERLAIQGENYLQALIDKRRAAAAFLPTISLAPSYFRQDPVTTGETGGQSRDTRTDVPVRGALLTGISDIASYRASARTIEQQRALLLDLQAIVLLETAQTYYQVLLAERSAEVLRNSLQVQEERLRDTRGRQAAGVGRALDVAQTAAQLAGTRVALITALNDVRTAREALALLVGAAVQQSPLVDVVDPPVAMQPLSVLVEQALAHRQDVAAARAAIEAARFDVRAAVGQYFPTISLNVNAFLSRDSNPTESDWNALLSANLPIFSAGLIEADVRTAWSQFRQALLNESLTRRQVEADVTTAYLNLLSSRNQLDELEVQVQAAEEALRQAEQSYKAGLVTNLERVTAQNDVLTAQLQLTTARLDYKVFYLTLLRAMGGLSTRLPGESGPAARQPVTQPMTQPMTRPAAQPPVVPPGSPTTGPIVQ